jgi:hypothetical protein
MVRASVTDMRMSRGGRGVAVAEAPAAKRMSRAVWAKARISGNAAPSASCCTPPTSPLRYRAATIGSRTSLTRLPITMHVIRCVSVERSFSARVRRGTRTARVGALTSATKVVEERPLMVPGTAAGEAMADTRREMC